MVGQYWKDTISYIDSISHVNEDFIARWHARHPRVFLLIVLGVIAVARTGGAILPVPIPEGLCLYLFLSSGYFALTARHRLERLYQKFVPPCAFPARL